MLVRLWLAFSIVAAGTAQALAVDETEAPIEHRLNLLEMVTGIPGPARIDVGLDWKYGSAVATKYMRAPKIAVGHSDRIAAALHVSSKDSNATALFTGESRVGVEIRSHSLGASLALATGKGRWEIAAPNEQELSVGAGAQPTLRLVDGKVGLNTDAAPTKSLHLQSNTKGDTILFQGNVEGKTAAMMDALVTLESSVDKRGRGLFLPHRDSAESGSANAWFAGVPSEGAGFSIGSSEDHSHESENGPYTKAKSRLFLTSDGAMGLGTTEPQGRLDIHVPASSKAADKAVNVKGGSMNVEFGQGLNTNGVAAVMGNKDRVELGSAAQGREIRLQTGSSFVVVSKDNGWVGVGGVTQPQAAMHVQGDVSVQAGAIRVEGAPADAEKMFTLDSKATTAAAVGFQQGGKNYMSIAAGVNGGLIEMANKTNLSVMGGKVGFGTLPTELVHIKGGNALLDGGASLWFGDSASGSKIWEDAGLHITTQKSGKVFVDNAEVFVSSKGASSSVRVISESASKASVQLLSGEASWEMHTTGSEDPTLLFSHQKELLALTKSGALGVGTAKPQAGLHVVGSALLQEADAAVYTTVHSRSESHLAGLRLVSGKSQWRLEAQGAPEGQFGSGTLRFVSGDRTHMVISKVGAVGIGLEAPLPGAVLHVKGPAMFDVGKEKGKIILSTPNANPGISFFSNAGSRVVDLETTSRGLAFMRSGRIGLGVRDAASRLHVFDGENSAITLSRNNKPEAHGVLSYNGAFMQLGSTTLHDGLQLLTANTPQVTLHSTGKFGIHTTTPVSDLQVGSRSHLFQVSDATYLTGNAFHDGTSFKFTTNSGAAGLKMYPSGAIGLITSQRGNAQQAIPAFDKPRLFVSEDGEIGVGTEAPDSDLHVASIKEASMQSNGAIMVGSSTSTANLVLDSRTLQARNKGQGAEMRVNPLGGDVSLFAQATDASTRVIFTEKGQIGFGMDTPEAKLHISEGTDKFTTVAVGDSPTKGAAVLRYKGSMLTMGFAKTGSAPMNQEDAIVVKADGSVGIGTTSPDATLGVKGDVSISGTLKVGGKKILSILEEMKEENRALRAELAEAKEMMMEMSANLRRMGEMQREEGRSLD